MTYKGEGFARDLSPDHLATYFPPKNVLFSGDAILGTSLGAQNVLALKTNFSKGRGEIVCLFTGNLSQGGNTLQYLLGIEGIHKMSINL